MGFARDVSTRVFYMDQGIVYEDGTPAQVFNAPQKPKTIEFVGRVCLKHARDMVRLLRESILADGKIDEVEAQMLSDGVISEEESRRISFILKRF